MKSADMEIDLTMERNFCEQVLNIDKTIRFAGITNSMGDMIVAKYSSSVTPLLSGVEAEVSAFQSTTKMDSVQALKNKLGKIIYVSEVFENVKRATMRLDNDCFLLVSFEACADHDFMIMNKILPLAKQIL
jgi:hypothetical protein